jgi:hypothetical protein
MAWPTRGTVDYTAVLRKGPIGSTKLAAFLLEELPYIWREAYIDMTSRRTNIVRWHYGSFEYLFDDHATLEVTGVVPHDPNVEARLIAALGRSVPREIARDDYRLKGWVGATEKNVRQGMGQGPLYRAFDRRKGGRPRGQRLRSAPRSQSGLVGGREAISRYGTVLCLEPWDLLL